MKIMFLHPNMPGQYKHLARILAEDEKNQVIFLTKPGKKDIKNVTKIEYELGRDVGPDVHRYLIGFERGVLLAQEVWRVCKKIKDEGFIPDVICGHFGWGEGLFIKDIFPDTPVLGFMEFFYSSQNSDVTFMQGTEIPDDDKARIRMKNSLHFFNLQYFDWLLTPTFYQLHRHPEEYYHKFSILHDGVDTEVAKPKKQNSLTLPNGVKLKPEDEIITYLSRNLEPYRGFPQFMKAAEKILKERPNAHIIVAGGDEVSYGKQPDGGKTFRQQMLEECDLDINRFHHFGFLPYDDMIKIMQISSIHVYLTVPFVLSWSMLEAMSCGCLILGSDTEPVTEVIKDGVNGLLVNFTSPDKIAARVSEVFEHENRMQHIRENARQTILDRYSLDKVIPLHIELIKDVAKGKFPPKAAGKIAKFNEETSVENWVAKNEKSKKSA